MNVSHAQRTRFSYPSRTISKIADGHPLVFIRTVTFLFPQAQDPSIWKLSLCHKIFDRSHGLFIEHNHFSDEEMNYVFIAVGRWSSSNHWYYCSVDSSNSTSFSFFQTSSRWKKVINPLSPKSDQHQISPCNISAL